MNNKPRIHLYIRGYCGNQFFQYAFARHIQEKIGGELIVNYSKVIQSQGTQFESDDLLNLFNVVPYKYESKAGWGGFIFKSLKFIHILFHLNTFSKRTYRFFLLCARILPVFGIYYFDAAYYPFKIYKRRNIYINGYFESSQYFRDIDDKLKMELTAKAPLLDHNTQLYDAITKNESVCITIKRMDVNNEEIADVYQYDISYFYKAIEYIKSRLDSPVFIVFSDDVQWCKDNIHIDAKVYYETPGNPIWEKIRLMSSCKHFIIHNSTFSWWAQHLSTNTNKIVVAPSKWMMRDDQPIDIYEEGWFYLKPNGEFSDCHE